MRTLRTWLVLAALLVVLPLAACGDTPADDTGGGTATPSAPPAEQPTDPSKADPGKTDGGGGSGGA